MRIGQESGVRSRNGWLLALILLSGCSAVRQELKPVRVATPTADEIVRRIEEARETVHSLKGMAKVRVVTRKADTTVTEAVVVKRPSSVRLDTLGFLTPMMVFASDGDVVNMAAGNKFYTGKLSSNRLASLPFPFNLFPMNEMTTILMGSTSVIKFESSEVAYSDAKGIHILTLRSRDGLRRQTIWVDAETSRLVKSEITDEGLGLVLTLAFERYQDAGGVSIPKDIDVRISPGNSRFHMQYEDVELNQTVNEDLFVIMPPEGVEVAPFQ